jgi:uncharacterized protein (TIGR02271 family)
MPQSTMTIDELQAARGEPVYSSDGEKIGSVEEIFYDEQTNQPEWVGIGTGFFGTKRVLVPLEGADLRGDALHVPYSKSHVKDSPDVDVDEISEDAERELYSYYGIQASERRSDTVLPEGREAPKGRRGETEVTRSEEELQVGKREVGAGRARLRKWVETEPVEADVELRRETARVTREPVDRRATGAEIGDEEVEVELRGEEPMVRKETVAKERVGLEKDVETDVETVRDQVRKERVDVEGDLDKR